jgi:hypothetical protein
VSGERRSGVGFFVLATRALDTATGADAGHSCLRPDSHRASIKFSSVGAIGRACHGTGQAGSSRPLRWQPGARERRPSSYAPQPSLCVLLHPWQ